MAKRRVNNDDDSDADVSQMLSATKRQRVDNDDHDEDRVREEETEEDKQFEATYAGQIMASIEAKQHFEGVRIRLGVFLGKLLDLPV